MNNKIFFVILIIGFLSMGTETVFATKRAIPISPAMKGVLDLAKGFGFTKGNIIAKIKNSPLPRGKRELDIYDYDYEDYYDSSASSESMSDDGRTTTTTNSSR
ncbi:hypothetical protein DMENIID0001_106390 [Sergentomyia squamirostris]